MFLAFFVLLMLTGAIGVLLWLSCQKVAAHMRDNPDAARAVAEHVIAPILMGRKIPPKDQKSPKPGEGTE